MNPERWRRLEALFEAVVSLAPEKRAAHLEEVCTDDHELRDQVLEMCRQSTRTDPLSDIVGEATEELASEMSSARIGERIGPYELVAEIGAGGMGVVYRAEQHEPVEREVALKVVNGFLPEEHRNRFAVEQQALARMKHPAIAPILDAGFTDSGSPWFAMELVPGDSIMRYADAQRLAIEQRLRLFVGVCRGVEHAHQKGILHRDLKPSNILVADVDGTPQGRIIDFGIAKVLDDPDEGATMMTGAGQLLGTPAYMSPEQARGDHHLLDTRSDVYSLGVILHELLVGRPPHAGDRTVGSWYDTVQRILTEEIKAPSTCLQAGKDVAGTAAARSESPHTLARRLRGDLDWITLRALELEPDRRYQRAAELADDVESYFSGDPVSAGPPGFRYRAGKFLRRHRISVIAAATVLAALVTALVVSLRMIHHAELRQASLCATLGQNELSSGRLERALPYFAEVLRRRPDDPSARELVGRAAREIDARIAHDYRTDGGWYSSAVHPAGRTLLTATIWPGETDDVDELFRHTLFDLESDSELAQFSARFRATPGARYSADGGTISLIQPGERIWMVDAISGEILANLDVGDERVVEVIVSPQRDRIALVRGTYRDHGLEVWRVDPPALEFKAEGRAVAWRAAFDASGKRLAAACEMEGDKTVVYIASDSGLQPVPSEADAVKLLAWSQKAGELLVVGQSKAELWSSDDRQLTRRIGHGGGTGVCALMGDARFVKATAGHALQIWNLRSETFEPALHGHTGAVQKIVPAADGRHMLSVGGDGVAFLWDRWRLDPVMRLPGPRDSLIDVGFDQDSSRAITIGMRGDISVWDLQRASPVRVEVTGKAVYAIHPLPDGKRVLMSRSDGVHVVSADTLESLVSMPRSSWLRVLPGCEQLVIMQDEHPPELRSTDTGRVLATLESEPVRFSGSAISPAGTHFVGVTHEHTRLWELPSGRLIAEVTNATKASGYCAFSPDGRRWFGSRRGNLGDLRSIDDFGTATVIEGGELSVWRFAFLPDNARLVGAGFEAMGVYDTVSGAQIGGIPTESRSTGAIRVSPDGQQIATICDDRSVKLWGIDGTSRARLIGHVDDVIDFAFDTTGRRIATIGRDNTVRLWLTADGSLVEVVQMRMSCYSVAFSTDDTKVFVGTAGAVVIIDCGPDRRDIAQIDDLLAEHGSWRFDDGSLLPK